MWKKDGCKKTGSMDIKDNSTVLCYFKIGVYKSGSILIEQLFWNDLPPWIRGKYDWYFHYRAALLRIKYPKLRHVIDSGTYQKKTKNIIKIKEIQLKKAITRVTTYEKNLELYRQSYSALFPIEDDPDYKSALNVLWNKKMNVEKIKEELKQLQNDRDNQQP